jgi:hypothetical protein
MDWEDNMKIDMRGKGLMGEEWNWFRIHPMAGLGARDIDFATRLLVSNIT